VSRRAALVALAVLAGCDMVYEVQVQLVSAGGLPSGFVCTNDAGQLVSQTAVTANGGAATIVIDVLDFGAELIPCRTNTMLDYCGEAGCPVTSRGCYAVQLAPSLSVSSVQQVLDALHAQDAGLVDLPDDRNLMIRLIGTTDTPAAACATADGSSFAVLDATKVFGCAYSCPIYLSASGAAQVQLETLGLPTTACMEVVDICATIETRSP
jgi:hypothetical protein